MGSPLQLARIDQLERLCRENAIDPPPRPASLAVLKNSFEKGLQRVASELSPYQRILDDLVTCASPAMFTKPFWDGPEEIRRFLDSRAKFNSKGELVSWDLSFIPLTSLPSLRGLRVIGILDLRHCELRSLPADLGETSIRVLILDNNQLEALPASIWDIRDCRSLSCEDNKIAELPPGISRLRGCINLNLKNNRIVNLPADMAQLRLGQASSDGASAVRLSGNDEMALIFYEDVNVTYETDDSEASPAIPLIPEEEEHEESCYDNPFDSGDESDDY